MTINLKNLAKLICTLAIVIFPLHQIILSYINIPFFWRQAVLWILLPVLFTNLNNLGGKKISLEQSIMLLGIICLIALQFIGLFFSLGGDNRNLGLSAFLLNIGFLPILFFFSSLDMNQLRSLMKIISFSGLLFAVYAIFSASTGMSLIDIDRLSGTNLIARGITRSGSVFGDSLTYGPIAVMALFASMCIFYRSNLSKNKFILIFIIMISSVGILLSGVRTAYLLLFIAIVIYHVFFPRKLNLKTNMIITYISISTIILTLAALYVPVFVKTPFWIVQSSRVGNSLSISDTGNMGRVSISKEAVNKVTSTVKNFIVGEGYGTSTNVNVNLLRTKNPIIVENQYLKVLYEQGLIGFILFMTFILSWLYVSTKNMLISRQSRDYYIYVYSFGLCVLMQIHMIFSPSFNLNYLYIYAFLGCGINWRLSDSMEKSKVQRTALEIK